jgi:glycosyltransferase involved in cell wall biosynthesis
VSFFAQQGHEVHWISRGGFRAPPGDPIRSYEIAPEPATPIRVARAAVQLRGLLRAIRPDLLHAHGAGGNGLVGALTGFHPYVVTAWGSEILILAKSMLWRPFVTFALRQADLVTCDGQHMVKAMVALGVTDRKIRLVGFGTDTERFRPGPPSVERRRALGVDERPMIISLRSLEPLYDIETLLRAIPLVLRRVPSAVFVIAGAGSEKDRLIQLAESLRITDAIRFPGQIANHLLPEYLTSADVYVSTSLSDAGLAASTAEAMACGLPVVVTDSGENALWVKDGEGGFVVPVRSPERLAEKIAHLLEDPEERTRYASYNRSVIEERNNYRIEMTRMATLYHELAGRHGTV